ncbi:MAG: class I SAM-dependent methyltransferase [Steroidobacteraceae bacterium]
MNSLADEVVALYERHAHYFDANRRRNPFVKKAWLDRFSSLLAPGASVLDIGCGHGEPIARYLIELGLNVRGVDSSPTLISLCRARFPGRPWLLADMRALALENKFHGLVAWDSFFHLWAEAHILAAEDPEVANAMAHLRLDPFRAFWAPKLEALATEIARGKGQRRKRNLGTPPSADGPTQTADMPAAPRRHRRRRS